MAETDEIFGIPVLALTNSEIAALLVAVRTMLCTDDPFAVPHWRALEDKLRDHLVARA